MRIQLLSINYEPERTGIAPYSTALARHLSKDHEVTVLTGLPHYPQWTVPAAYRHWRAEERDDSLRVIRLGHYVPRAPGVYSRTAYELSWALRAACAGVRIPTDLVIGVVPALFGAHAARMVARRRRVPFGLIVQDVMSNAATQGGVHGSARIARLAVSTERSALRAATGVCTIHPRLAEVLQRVADLPALPSVIYNWTHVCRPDSLRMIRQRFGWQDDELVALHSGNMGRKQNLEVVVDAARLAQRTGARVRFVLAGDGSQRAPLERYAAGCRQLDFIDGVADEDYLDLLHSADVLVVNERPGMREMSLPSKLTSYLIAERPIVAATDEGSATAEFIGASGGGVLSPAGEPAELLANVTAVASDAERAGVLVSNGRRFAQRHLTSTRALDNYAHWIDGLASGHKRASV